jgi:hypothetical protein
VGSTCRRQTHPRALALSRCSVGPAHQHRSPFARPLNLTRGACLSDPSSPNRPRSPPWRRPRPRDFRQRPHTPKPFMDPPSLTRPPRSVAPSAEHPRPLSRSAHVPRKFHRRSPWSRARSVVAVEPSSCLLPRKAPPYQPQPRTPLNSSPSPLVRLVRAH